MMTAVYYGPVINPESLTAFQTLRRCLIAVGSDGNIIWIVEDINSSELELVLEQHGLFQGNYTLVRLKSGEFIMPGFIDTHIVSVSFLPSRSVQLTFDIACLSTAQSRIVCMTLRS